MYIYIYIYIYLFIYYYLCSLREAVELSGMSEYEMQHVQQARPTRAHARVHVENIRKHTANLYTKILNLRGFNSSRILILRGEIIT